MVGCFSLIFFRMKVPCNFPDVECLECVRLSVFQFQPAGSSSIRDLRQTAQATSAGGQRMFRRLRTGIDSHVPWLVFSGLFDWTVVFPTIRMPVCAVTLDPAPNIYSNVHCATLPLCLLSSVCFVLSDHVSGVGKSNDWMSLLGFQHSIQIPAYRLKHLIKWVPCMPHGGRGLNLCPVFSVCKWEET